MAEHFNFPVLWSVMTSPTDSVMRSAIEANAMLYCMARGVKDGQELIEVSGEFILALANSDSMAKIARGYETTAARQGQIAGLVLMNFYVLSRDSKVEASINKAVHIVAKQSAICKVWPDGSKTPLERNSIFAAWADFKSVAHIWAARALIESLEGFQPAIKFNYQRDFVEVLEWSEGFRIWAETYRQKRSRHPVVGENQLWRPSAESAIRPRSLSKEISSLSPTLAAWLRDYRAPMAI
jgi:hypothetical protein